MAMLKRIILILLMLSMASSVGAQITVPNQLVVFNRWFASAANANFTELAKGLNRTSGGTITGTIVVSDGVTIDGADISTYLAGGKLTASSNTVNAVSVGGGITANGVPLVDATGKVTAISSTYFALLNGSALTALNAANLSGTITSATQDLITRTGTVVSGTWSAAFGAVSGAPLTSLNASNFSTGTVPPARLGSGSPDINMLLRGDQTWASLAGSSIPSNLIVFSSTGTCQTGFTEFTAARGFAIVGMPAGGTSQGTVGSAFTNLENRSHNHSVPGLNIPALNHPLAFASMSVDGDHAHSLATDGPSSTNTFDDVDPSFNWASTTHIHGASMSTPGGHSHGGSMSGGTTGTGTAGNASTTNVMSYIQVIACKKD